MSGGQPPKRQTTKRKTAHRRSSFLVKLGRVVNAKSPVKVYTTRRESGKKLASSLKKTK